MAFTNCFITGEPFDGTVKFYPLVDNCHLYEFKIVGRVYISEFARLVLERNKNIDKNILAGMCRYAFEMHENPQLIDTNLLNELENVLIYPKSFTEKCDHLLKLLYEIGGKENKCFTLNSVLDYPMAFANSAEEFNRIVSFLEKQEFIQWANKISAEEDSFTLFMEVEFTKSGINHVSKSQNLVIGLSSQNIRTGDLSIDNKLQHARNLFFKENSTFDDKRSACETLSFLLESYKTKLEEFFTIQDTKTFFRIVNEFDIRHNKPSTSKIEHEEQFEWIYNSLLNTIITYIKLEKKQTTANK